MLTASALRTYPCPSCNQIINTGVSACEYCSAPVSEAAGEIAADRHQKFLTAFAEANSMVITARCFLVALLTSFSPLLSSVGTLGFLLLLVWVPFLLVRWHRRYSKLDASNTDFIQARRWVKESILIWSVALLVTPVWMYLKFGTFR
jgi:hypothetical protein